MSQRASGGLIGQVIDAVIRFCLENKLIVALLLIAVLGVGVMIMPFDYESSIFPRDPVPVDAIPDIGENQQIVFTEWMGRSPQDVEDQITYPLTVSLLGVPEVKSIRSYSFLGFSSIYVVFNEKADFYWSRSRVLERLSVAQKELPEGITPALGPDATALGQVYWYTLEGRDKKTGRPAGGWDLDELRTIQDWNVRYALASVEGVSEVASVGGFVSEYQIDVDPDAMRAYGVTLQQVYSAVRASNIDVGARTIEINRAEYVIRGLGFLRSVEDIRQTVITSRDNVPVLIDNVAHVGRGPALRRGALDKAGSEAVGGVVVVRYGENPMAVIKRVKQKIKDIDAGLPEKVLPDGSVSKVQIVPFYDRTKLIGETLGTLENALSEEILVTIIVIIVMVMHLRSSMLISALLPLSVGIAFIAMKATGVDANLMSLAGIAIAIGTMVDMGIILCENILKHLDEAPPDEPRLEVIFRAASEVGRPVLTAVLTTVISFLPVFFMVGAEGKLFKPLAFTKTYALLASVLVALTLLPAVAHVLFAMRMPKNIKSTFAFAWAVRLGIGLLAASGLLTMVIDLLGGWPLFWLGVMLVLWALYMGVRPYIPKAAIAWLTRATNVVAVLVVLVVLTRHWMPLGIDKGFIRNLIFITVCLSSLLLVFLVFMRLYEPLLRFFLRFKLLFYVMPLSTLLLGVVIWRGFDNVLPFVPRAVQRLGLPDEFRFRVGLFGGGKEYRVHAPWAWAAQAFPGLGREFMPPLDEGSYLYMPTTMPHASIGEALDVLQKQDVAIAAIPEIDSVVGKIGRVESPLDPAPISMVETIITYKPEYIVDDNERIKLFRYDRQTYRFVTDDEGELIEDPRGKPFRQWRDHIRRPADIWDEIVKVAQVPGSTGAPELQPIAARIVMLQTGVRAPMAVRILGDDLSEIEQVGLTIEKLLKEVPGVEPGTVVADRIIGKPYLEIEIDRRAIARYGISIRQVQDVIETAIGGRRITTTVQGRERYGVRVRYPRELRDTIESIERILVAANDGSQIPLKQMARIDYLRGPQVIRTEDTRYVGYVIFDKQEGFAEVDVVETAQRYLDAKIEEAAARQAAEGAAWRPREGELILPAGTERPTFIGSYENQVRSAKTLAMVVPLALFLIFIILYLHFRSGSSMVISILTTFLVWTGVLVACSGGMILIWLYSTPWFADITLFEVNMRDLFQVHPINLSVAVAVGFIALLGIATDDGVVIGTYLNDTFASRKPDSIAAIREATLYAGKRRIRPCLMTTATTILALIPVLTSTGRGSDVMVPMAIPSYGGMLIELMTLFVVPVSYCWIQEIRFRLSGLVEPSPDPPQPVEVPLSADVIES